jgi:hypothetical protein
MVVLDSSLPADFIGHVRCNLYGVIMIPPRINSSAILFCRIYNAYQLPEYKSRRTGRSHLYVSPPQPLRVMQSLSTFDTDQ